MAKRYAVLQKKLRELESELNYVFAIPASETPCHKLISESIDRRLSFLRSLLSAEIESHPSKPHHLQHIDQRLIELETAFHDWDNFRTLAINHIDSASECSCTESCLNDDGVGSLDMGSPVLEDGIGSLDMGSPVLEDGVGSLDMGSLLEGLEYTSEDQTAAVVNKIEGDMKEERRAWIGRRDGIKTGLKFAVVVLGVVMVRLSGCYYYKGVMEVFPTPT